MSKLSIFFILCFVPHIFALEIYSSVTKIDLPPGVAAPDSVALDPKNEGPYACVDDGRILKYTGPKFGWIDFAYTSPTRTKQLCDGTKDINLGPICGRCLGFSFDPLTGDLYIADTFNGLFVVGPKGGLATLLINSAEGVRFRFLNGIDFDSATRNVYFIDTSTKIDLRNVTRGNFPTDSTGRLLRYNVLTKQVKVLLNGLSGPVGPAISIDRTFVLFSERDKNRVLKHWLLGLKANTTEVILDGPGTPRKIKRATAPGEFWVALTIATINPPLNVPFAYKIDSFGKVLLRKGLEELYFNQTVSVIQEYRGVILYIGSRSPSVTYVGIYTTKF